MKYYCCHALLCDNQCITRECLRIYGITDCKSHGVEKLVYVVFVLRKGIAVADPGGGAF